MASQNMFASAGAVAEKVVAQTVSEAGTCSSLPRINSVARAANRHRAKNRPWHPATLDSQLLEQHLPPRLLRADIQLHDKDGKISAWHMLFASDEQLELLTKAKTWYVVICTSIGLCSVGKYCRNQIYYCVSGVGKVI